MSRLLAKLFPTRFVRHSFATHLSGVFAIEPRPLSLAVEHARSVIAATPAAEIRALAAAPRAEEPRLYMEELEPRDPTNPFSKPTYCARIPIHGVIVHGDASCARFMGVDSTGIDEIQCALDYALADESVTEIVFDVCSPGGTATGLQKIVATIRAGKKRKPIRAEVTGECASAAYQLVAHCTEIVAEESALVGSIGTYAVIQDSSKAFESIGITVHVVRSGIHKGVGVDGAPITSDQLAAVQIVVNDLSAIFTRTVAEGRGLSDEAVKAIATGDIWIASKALELGLIDAISKAEIEEEDAPTGAGDPNMTTKPAAAAPVLATTTTPAPASAPNAELDQARAELAAEKATNADLKAAVVKAEAERDLAKNALDDYRWNALKSVIDVHAKAGRVVPADRPEVERIARAAYLNELDGPAKLNAELGKRRQETKPTPAVNTDELPKQPDVDAEAAITDSKIRAALDDQLVKALDIPLERAQALRRIHGLRADGKPVDAQGNVVDIPQPKTATGPTA